MKEAIVMPILQIRKLRQKSCEVPSSRLDKLLLDLKIESSSLKYSSRLVRSFPGEKGDSCSWTMIKKWLFRGAASEGERHLKPTEEKCTYFFPFYSQHNHRINKQPRVLKTTFLGLVSDGIPDKQIQLPSEGCSELSGIPFRQKSCTHRTTYRIKI